MSERTKRANLRMLWLLQRLADSHGYAVAWDEEWVDDFVEAFPEAKRTLKYYLIGANSSPMLNRAAARAMNAGFIIPDHVGTTDARSFNQRTWARAWKITHQGREYLQMIHAGKT